MIKEHKKELLMIILVLLFIIVLIGVSYAAFSYTGRGEKINTITTGAITMSYEETDNVINMSGALPTTDKTGMIRLTEGEYFDFKISSSISGNTNINYEISAKKEDGNTIDGSNIKLYLTKVNSDGTEEALMVPETYNEETSSNSYTGRPENEMSLYTSSMNSSENNSYRLRMYVDESYNPQGDGGNLEFSVKINVYGKVGDKYVPETTKTILEDNEVQVEKKQMFNYASNGMKYGINEADPNYITNGLYSTEDEDGVSYYFRGAVDNNNVQFGEYKEDYYVYAYNYADASIIPFYQSLENCAEAHGGQSSRCYQVKLASAGDEMYWKIVRVNGDGSLRLIYNGTSVNSNYQNTVTIIGSYLVGRTRYNSSDVGSGYTYDNGIASFIKNEVDIWYNNALSNTEYDSKIIGGRFCSDSSGYNYDDSKHYASYNRLGQVWESSTKDNEPTLKCPSTSESYGGSYRLKAGLITADELVFAGENLVVISNSYLNLEGIGESYWSMTPNSTSEVWGINYFNNKKALIPEILVMDRGIRPVINVATDEGFTSGDGTEENPYIIQ